ncbi:Peptidase A1 domain-containing protein [Aphelenchoides fujianensis]|nr:Peptidase A1 domain-containing protein [Aphelenchoides fujianensis]
MVGCRNTGLMSQHCHAQKGVYEPRKSRTARAQRLMFHVDLGIPRGKQLELRRPVVFGGARPHGGRRSRHSRPHVQLSRRSRAFDLRRGRPAARRAARFLRLLPQVRPMGSENCADAGQVTIGGQDAQNCGRVLDWAPVFHGSTDWTTFVVDSFQVGRFYNWNRPFKAIRACWCPAVGDIPVHVFIRGRRYTIPVAEVTQKLGHDKCLLLLGDHDEEEWIFGDPFIRTFCQVHDWKRRRIGFAPAKRTRK